MRTISHAVLSASIGSVNTTGFVDKRCLLVSASGLYTMALLCAVLAFYKTQACIPQTVSCLRMTL